MKTVAEALKAFMSVPFPEPPEDDRLSDWLIEVEELGGYYVGIAATIARGARLKYPVDLQEIEAKENALLSIASETGDADEVIALRKYIGALKAVVLALIEHRQMDPGGE